MGKGRVLAITADSYFMQTFLREGFQANEGAAEWADELVTHWVDRPACETDESYRQVIPYVIVNAYGLGTLAYRRKGSESRLHGDLSIGFGGHVNESDMTDRNLMVDNAARRELIEEIAGVDPRQFDAIQWRGFLRDDSNPVGRVHIGIVGTVNIVIGDDTPELTEGDSAGWHPGCDLALPGMLSLFESWSQIIITQAPNLLSE